MSRPSRRTRRTLPHVVERMTFEERTSGWPMPAISGLNQFVVASVSTYKSKITPFPRVLIVCQTGSIGLNDLPRTAVMRATLIRAQDQSKLIRTALDEILEGIFGRLPPIDFALRRIVGANFLAKCQLHHWHHTGCRSGMSRGSIIGRGSIRPLPSGVERLVPSRSFRLSEVEKGVGGRDAGPYSASALEHASVEVAKAANAVPVSVTDEAVPSAPDESLDHHPLDHAERCALVVPVGDDIEVGARERGGTAGRPLP